jgi:hypothetical protein
MGKRKVGAMKGILIQRICLRGALLLLVLLLVVSCGGAGTPEQTPSTTVVETAALPGPTLEPIPTGLVRSPVPDSARDTASAVLAAEHPPIDYYRLAVQLKGIATDLLTPQPPQTGEPQVDDQTVFLVSGTLDSAGEEYKSFPAQLRHISDHARWWASGEDSLSDQEIVAAATRFEETVLPINQKLFGTEWSPGIDGDSRIHILLIQQPEAENVNGYFSNINEYPQAIFKNSNQKEIIFLNHGASGLDTEAFAGEIAHEYQHLIHWNQDPNEDLWLNEAMSSLVSPEDIAVGGLSNAILFSRNPDIQLTARPETSFDIQDEAHYAHYAAERLFAIYLLEQFGADFVRGVVENPAPGVVSIQEELNKVEGAPKFDNVYATWLLANFLDMPDLRQGQFGYVNTDPVDPEPQVIRSIDGEPLRDRLPPYGARYYQINSIQPVKVDLSGSTQARLTPADPAEGQYAWYSNRGDNSDFTLTRSFDLSGLQKATLNYQVWFELEPFFDYAYLEVSTDKGEHWTVLKTMHGTDEDPNRMAYGVGYSGESGDWLSESIDLSAYAGDEIQIRFEVLTDYTTNRDGLQLDNIEIPELNFYDGAEDEGAGWEAQGFVRSTNIVPASWVAWVVTPGTDPNIEWIDLQPGQSASFEIASFSEEYPFALLVLSPTAPVTTQELDYELILRH